MNREQRDIVFKIGNIINDGVIQEMQDRYKCKQKPDKNTRESNVRHCNWELLSETDSINSCTTLLYILKPHPTTRSQNIYQKWK